MVASDGNWTNRVSLQYVGRCQTQQIAHMPWPARFEQSHPSRALPNAHSGGSRVPDVHKQRRLPLKMPKKVSCRNVLTLSQVTKPRLTHHLGGTDGTGCRLVFVQHLKCSKAPCTSLWRIWKEWTRSDSRWLPGCRIWQNDKEVNNSLEGHERAFLEKCRLWNLKLNGAKVKQHQSSVKFTGNQLTSRPKAQPEKIQAKLQWPQPEDGTALKRFLGMET